MRRRSFLARAGAGTLSLAGAGALSTTAATDARGATGSAGVAQAEFGPSGSVRVPGAAEAVVGPDGETAYVAATDGFAVVDVSDPASPEILAENHDVAGDVEGGPLSNIHDVKVSGDRLIAVGPRGYSGMREFSGMALYDVSDPASPERLAFFETEYGIHNAEFEDGTAYLTRTAEGDEPIVVVDVSDEDPEAVGRWSLVDAEPGYAEVEQPLRNGHDVTVRDGVAYVSYWDAGTWVVDLSDPSSPEVLATLAGRPLEELRAIDGDAAFPETVEAPGNAHNTALSDDGSLLAVGREIFDMPQTEAVSPPGGIALWDVSDLSDPERLTVLAPPDPGSGEDRVTTTTHNCHFRGDRLYTSWYQGGVRVFDVSAPAEPVELGSWADREHTFFWTAVPAHEGFVASSHSDPSEGEDAADYGELYTFPEPGDDGQPAATRTETADMSDGNATTTTTAGGTTTGTDTATTAGGETTTAGGTDTTNGGTDDGTGTTTATGPGFGVVTALAGGALAVERLVRGRGGE